jgi:NhaP-type Na+/H+ or K+/H+ antiporter
LSGNAYRVAALPLYVRCGETETLPGAILAALLLVYSAIAGRIGRSWLSGPILFTAAGLMLGPEGLGLLHLKVDAEGVRLLAEATLAMVLFTEAANADLVVVRRDLAIPKRLLLIGLPLTIALGFLVAALVFPQFDPLEMALVAAILAPTDAALGRPVVTNRAVPAPVRESLNVESGLNDGICVPVVVILLDLAIGIQNQGYSLTHMARVVAAEIGIGLAVGLALTGSAILLLRAAVKLDWVSEAWVEIPVVAAAVACFAAAQAIGGSGFIACFAGGLLVSWLAPRRKHDLLRGAEAVGETLAFLTWIAFGAVVIGQMLGGVTVSVLLYAALSLTVIRMLPVFLCLAGTGMNATSKLFIGWFGPRGLASIVFGIIAFDENLPGNDTLGAVVVTTVLLSVVAHGVTANPLVAALRTRLAVDTRTQHYSR